MQQWMIWWKQVHIFSLFYEIKVLECLLDVIGNVLYPDNVELALGLSFACFC
jgi:hypothetical protein